MGADSITCIVLPGCNNDGVGYNFGEHGIFHGLTATIGFWHNNNGQALIKSFGTTSSGLTLANWLATTAQPVRQQRPRLERQLDDRDQPNGPRTPTLPTTS